MKGTGIINFLNTKTPKEDLEITLRVIREFKNNESALEWGAIPFAAWAKFEQLQEYLEFLVEGKQLEKDTLEYIQ